MKYKIIEPVQEQESFLGKGLRNAVGALGQLGSTIAAPFQAQENLQKQSRQISERIITNKNIPENLKGGVKKVLSEQKEPLITTEKVKKTVEGVFPEKYLEPKTKNEAIAQEYLSMIPLHYLTGGTTKALPAFLGRAAVGRHAGEAVKQAGGGEAGRIATEIAVPTLIQALNPARIKNFFSAKNAELYNEIPEIAKGHKVNSKPLHDTFENINKSVRGSKSKSQYYKNLNILKNDIHGGEIPLTELRPLQAELNNWVYKENLDKFKPALNAVNGMIDTASKEIPKYGEVLKKANKLYPILKNVDATESFMTKLLETPGLRKKASKVLFGNNINEAIPLAAKLSYNFPKESKEYIMKAFDAASRQQAPQFIKEINKLDKLIDNSKEQPKKYKIIEPI